MTDQETNDRDDKTVVVSAGMDPSAGQAVPADLPAQYVEDGSASMYEQTPWQQHTSIHAGPYRLDEPFPTMEVVRPDGVEPEDSYMKHHERDLQHKYLNFCRYELGDDINMEWNQYAADMNGSTQPARPDTYELSLVFWTENGDERMLHEVEEQFQATLADKLDVEPATPSRTYQ